MKGLSQLLGRKARWAVAAAGCVAGLGLAPAAASATIYVDAVNGEDVGDCLTPAAPCETIAAGVSFAPTPTETVRVESGTYTNFNVSRGISVVASDFNANNSDPRPVIDGHPSGPAVNVMPAAQLPGTIEGFTINGEYSSMDIADSITVQNNFFNEDDPATRPTLGDLGPDVHVTGGTVTVRNNTFEDSLPIDAQGGIAVEGGSVKVENNTFDSLRSGISALGVLDLEITGNTITGLHQAELPPEDPPPDPPVPNFVEGFGVSLSDSSSTITDNLIHQPALAGSPVGISLSDSDPAVAPDSNAELRRNRVFDHDFGVFVASGGGDISLEGDLLANNTADGVGFFGPFDPPPAPLSITNATIYGNAQDIELFGAAMTMDSTAVEDPIALTDSTCTITNSRGPTTTGDACQSFQTTAAPGFVNPSLNDFHLTLSSPLIDAGNPTALPAGSIDFDGNGRELDGNCDGDARRDIGADEAVRDCTPPPPPPPPPPPTDTPDTTPPNTTIKKGPKGRTKDQTPTFKFSADEPGATFRCRLDKQTYGRCDRKETFHANIRRHVVSVYAVDSAGNRDPTPAKRIFRVIDRR